jgi:hypothetical protein
VSARVSLRGSVRTRWRTPVGRLSGSGVYRTVYRRSRKGAKRGSQKGTQPFKVARFQYPTDIPDGPGSATPGRSVCVTDLLFQVEKAWPSGTRYHRQTAPQPARPPWPNGQNTIFRSMRNKRSCGAASRAPGWMPYWAPPSSAGRSRRGGTPRWRSRRSSTSSPVYEASPDEVGLRPVVYGRYRDPHSISREPVSTGFRFSASTPSARRLFAWREPRAAENGSHPSQPFRPHKINNIPPKTPQKA